MISWLKNLAYLEHIALRSNPLSGRLLTGSDSI